MSKSSITYSKDIIKRVSEKHGIPEDRVEYAFRFFFRMMRHFMKDPKVNAISWPNFGVFYTSIPLLKNKQRGLSISQGDSPKLGVKTELLTTEYRLVDLEKRSAELKARTFLGMYQDLVHNSLPMLYRTWYRKGKTDKELEEFQNEA